MNAAVVHKCSKVDRHPEWLTFSIIGMRNVYCLLLPALDVPLLAVGVALVAFFSESFLFVA